MANDSRYGLNSSVFTRDLAKGERIARDLSAGNACVNDALINYGATELPFGGTGESGIGVRHGAQGIQKYCEVQSVLVTRFAPKRDIYMYPYSPAKSRLVESFSKLLYGRVPRKYRDR
jgi:delta 1-pyrroline-5-carboxylate dehydrogenase